VLQNYVVAFDGRIICEVVPVYYKMPKKDKAGSARKTRLVVFRFDEIRFRPADDSKASAALVQMHSGSDKRRTGFGSIGKVVIDTTDLLKHVNRSLKNAGVSEESLSIKATSTLVWPDLSRNMKGVLHTWLDKGVFRPAIYRMKPSREGCELDRSDQVVVGLLYGLFSFGAKHAAFSNPIKPLEES